MGAPLSITQGDLSIHPAGNEIAGAALVLVLVDDFLDVVLTVEVAFDVVFADEVILDVDLAVDVLAVEVSLDVVLTVLVDLDVVLAVEVLAVLVDLEDVLTVEVDFEAVLVLDETTRTPGTTSKLKYDLESHQEIYTVELDKIIRLQYCRVCLDDLRSSLHDVQIIC